MKDSGASARVPARGLTLTQPWASLVALGAKRIETRSWRNPYRGPVAIHAAKGLSSVGGADGLLALCTTEPFSSVLGKALGVDHERPDGMTWREVSLPLGCIVAVAELANIAPTEDVVAYGARSFDGADNELAFGNYAAGRWAWVLRDVRPLAEPIPCKGALGLWDVPPAERTAMMKQLGA